MRQKVAAGLQITGLLTGVAAGLTVSLGLGLAVASVGLILFGIATERA